MKMKKLFVLLGIMALIATSCNEQKCKESSKACCESESKVNTIELADGAIMHHEYVKTIGRMAYVWGWTMVNSHNRRANITQAPEPGKLGGVVPVAPVNHLCMLNDYVEPNQSFVACPNQDVAYGLGFYALNDEPAIIQVPDFGDRFWVFAIYDARTDQIGKLGKPYASKPGFYMLVGPNWKGEKPQDVVDVIHSTTELVNIIPRVFMDDTDEDRKIVKSIVNEINSYPLSEFDGQMKVKDWSDLPTFPVPEVEGERAWVDADKFFDQLPGVMDLVPAMPGEEALYASIRQVLAAAEKDPTIKEILVETAIAAEKELIKPLFLWKHNGVPAGNGWNRSKNNAQWGFDYLMRTSTARSNMYDNRPTETQYLYTDNDVNEEQLQGTNLYSITFPAGELPPVNGFWSLTLYNKHHIFETNKLNRYSLGTKSKDLKYNDDGSLTLYAGANAPGGDMDANWLPAPGETFSLYIRCYWGKEAILDGSWTPPVIELVK